MRSPRRPAPLKQTPPSDGIRSSQGRLQGFVCGRESGGVAVPSCRVCPVFDALGVMFPCLRGSILSRLVSFIRPGLGHWVLCRRRCLQRRGYPQWIRPALTSNSAKKQDRDAENVRRHPPDPFTYAPRARAQSSGWRRRRTLGDCRAGLRMAAGLLGWGVSRTGGFVDLLRR